MIASRRSIFLFNKKCYTSKTGLLTGCFSSNGSQAKGAATNELLRLDIAKILKDSLAAGKHGEIRTLFNHSGFNALTVVGLGNESEGSRDFRFIQRIRSAVTKGVKVLKDYGIEEIQVDHFGFPKAAAEGAMLGLYSFNIKTKKLTNDIKVRIVDEVSEQQRIQWNFGVTCGAAQNLARELSDHPSNLMTPSIFCERILKEAKELSGISIRVLDQCEIEKIGMNTFLAVSKGSIEQPKLLEIIYKGSSGPIDVALVGKGITFDSYLIVFFLFTYF